MSSTHHQDPSAAPADAGAAAGADAPRRGRRWRRRLGWVLAWAVTSAVVLVGLLLVGERYGANPRIGERPAFGSTGQEIFQRNCAVCHGPAGQGGKGPAFTPGGPLSTLTFDERVTFIGDPRSGLDIMPAWERRGMSKEQLRQVAAYTQILSGQQPEPGVEGVK